MNIFKIVILMSVLLSMLPKYLYGQDRKSIPSTKEIRELLSSANKKNEGNKVITELSKIEYSIFPSLIEILQDKNESNSLRTNALSILVKARELRAVEPLIENINEYSLLDNEGAALTSLNVITRNDFGGSKIAWKEWWSKAWPKYLRSVGECSNPEVKRNKNEEPCWLIVKIALEELASPADSLTHISRCMYRNQTVYYEPPRCCDRASVLWDENGGKICSPDGGFFGVGDGKCQNFFNDKKDCEIIWKDNRASH